MVRRSATIVFLSRGRKVLGRAHRQPFDRSSIDRMNEAPKQDQPGHSRAHAMGVVLEPPPPCGRPHGRRERWVRNSSRPPPRRARTGGRSLRGEPRAPYIVSWPGQPAAEVLSRRHPATASCSVTRGRESVGDGCPASSRQRCQMA
jgi:hypothetical protein